MRNGLAAREDVRATFQGTVERFGKKIGWGGKTEETILLINVCDAGGKPVCQHLWFAVTKAFARLNLQPGDQVVFDARVQRYIKGYRGRRLDIYKPVAIDYHLTRPTKVRKVGTVADNTKPLAS